MASLYLDQIGDFIEATLKLYKRDDWVDISLPLQNYYFADRIFKSKTEKAEASGPLVEWKLRVANQGTFKFTGLFAVDTTNRVNVLTHANMPWALSTVNYIYDIKENAFQGGPETIIKEMDLHEQGLMNDFFAGMETAVWTQPLSATVDPRPLSGIPFWLQQAANSAANYAFGFNGGDPGSGWYAGGIQTGQYTNWKNGTFIYNQITRDDLIEKIIAAMDFCYFKPPAPFPMLGAQKPDWGLYTTHGVLATLRKLLQFANDNLGDDVAAHSGNVYVRGVPVEWVPALTNTASDAYVTNSPFYGINWSKFEYIFRSGMNMVKRPPFQVANQHDTRMRCMDNTGQLVCYDRRANFVGYSPTITTS